MGHHTIQTDARKYHCERAKETHQLRDQTLSTDVLMQLFVHRGDTKDWNLVVDLVDHLPHLRRERRRIANGANVNSHRVSRLVCNLKYRAIDCGLRLIARVRRRLDVSDNTNNLDRTTALGIIKCEGAPDWVLILDVMIDETRVDDGDSRR